ncbi:MAG: hypothetical protein L6V95_13455 [Candidatus Melainabacteria bacterium]|nr:MAG: hypothetical protein L6V95_13455 [Candidatus Melainabacteria bacterium]
MTIKTNLLLKKNNQEPQINILKDPIQGGWDYNATFEHTNDINNDFNDKPNSQVMGKIPPVKEFELPSNVSVLKKSYKTTSKWSHKTNRCSNY